MFRSTFITLCLISLISSVSAWDDDAWDSWSRDDDTWGRHHCPSDCTCCVNGRCADTEECKRALAVVGIVIAVVIGGICLCCCIIVCATLRMRKAGQRRFPQTQMSTPAPMPQQGGVQGIPVGVAAPYPPPQQGYGYPTSGYPPAPQFNNPPPPMVPAAYPAGQQPGQAGVPGNRDVTPGYPTAPAPQAAQATAPPPKQL
eukprot:TRINITY_DN66742_c5_g2_i1.p1 TRINITY_DN66742_c5_g2~~TRINITY_DN66742_c5_g2_i1.p1  ORF type:complete len:200 (-),score=8.50 TRINITY_DN66742_c5_g2_i1:221-820(-)